MSVINGVLKKIRAVCDKKKSYMSCHSVRNGLSFYQNDNITICCMTLSEDVRICDINEDSDTIIKSVLKKRKSMISDFKKGKIYDCCKNCQFLQQHTDSGSETEQLLEISFNHFVTCNLNCIHCGYAAKVQSGELRDTDHARVASVLESLYKKGLISQDCRAHIGGGEPSINKGVRQVIEFLTGKKITTNINSNGAKFVKEFAANDLIYLILTPDAGSKEVYTKIKGGDFFDTVWDNIAKYMEVNRERVYIKFVLTENNLHDIENMVKECVKANVKNIVISFDNNIQATEYYKYKEHILTFARLCKENNFIYGYALVPGELIPQDSDIISTVKDQTSIVEIQAVIGNCEENSMPVVSTLDSKQIDFQQIEYIKRYVDNRFLEKEIVELLRETSLAQVINQIKPYYTDVIFIDPTKTAVITYNKKLLKNAIEYYQVNRTSFDVMPLFILADWDGNYDQELETIKEKYSVEIIPLAHCFTINKSFSLYTVPCDNLEDATAWDFAHLTYLIYRVGIRSHFSYNYFSLNHLRAIGPTQNFEMFMLRIDDISRCYKMMEDDESKDAYIRAIYHYFLNPTLGYNIHSNYDQYQHPYVHPEEGDVMIEGGGYDGATALQFASQVGLSGKVIVFEPDYEQYLIVCENTKNYTNIEAENLGLYDKKGSFFISDCAGSGTISSEKGLNGQECKVSDIDSYLEGREEVKVSLLKMDIEGAELPCLKGAYNTIKKYMPKLQVCLYHSYNDHIDIPLWINNNFPEYKIYVGKHMIWRAETVLYALPPSHGKY